MMAPPSKKQRQLPPSSDFDLSHLSLNTKSTPTRSSRTKKVLTFADEHATSLEEVQNEEEFHISSSQSGCAAAVSNIDLKSPLILDLGAFNAKIGLASDVAPRRVLNAVVKAKSEKKRQFVGNELAEQCHDLHGLFFINPISSGFICHWETQLRLFDYFFSPQVLNINPSEHELVLTESFINMHNRRKTLYEVLFEYYDFPSVYLTFPELLSGIKYQQTENYMPHFMVVDFGHEATSFMPFINCLPAPRHAKRLDVGGKKLTNLLMHALSFRYFNVLDCWWTCNQVKENACYIAEDFRQEVRNCELELKNTSSSNSDGITRFVTLPDYVTYREPQIRTRSEQAEMRKAGKVSRDDQVMPFCIERIEIGECLFEPRQIGSPKFGVAKACALVADQFEDDVQTVMLNSIVLTGGCSKMPGLGPRLQKEVQQLSPSGEGAEYVKVRMQQEGIDPIDSAWYGGKTLVTHEKWREFYENGRIRKSEWQELGYERVAANKLPYN